MREGERRGGRRRPPERHNGGAGMFSLLVVMALTALVTVLIMLHITNADGDGAACPAVCPVCGEELTADKSGVPDNTTAATAANEEREAQLAAALALREQYGRIVWLDAGHGGIDGGAAAVHNGVTYLEKDIVLDIVLMAYELFQNSPSGIKAILTRDEDEYIARGQRPLMWNDTADLAVSVHLNFFSHADAALVQTVYGIETYFWDNAVYTERVNITTNAQFAQIMQNHLVAQTGARDRRIRNDQEFTILARSAIPAVLVEAGFMSNNAELALLVTEQYQRRIAQAIYDGVAEAFS